MKKISLVLALVLAVALMAAPAMAGSISFSVKTWDVKASSGASTFSGNIGTGGSLGSAWNSSCATVKFSNDPKVTTNATTVGGTFGLGFNVSTQFGNAAARGSFSGIDFGGGLR